MSRTRIVKGNITKIVGKSYKIYSKENIENYSEKKIIQVGKEKGVSYGSPEAPPESPMIWKPNAEFKGHVIFCNGFHSGVVGAVNAALSKTIGLEKKSWFLPYGDHTHHKRGDMEIKDMKTEVQPSDLDEDILDSSEVLAAEKPHRYIEIERGWMILPSFREPVVKEEPSDKKLLDKFKGYWNDYTSKYRAVDLYTTYFNAEKRDHYINGSHGMGSTAWERECHGITLGYHWAVKNWKLKSKEEVEQAKKDNPNAVSYSPAYQPLTFVGHSEGAAVAVGACIGAMYYAAEKGWDEMAVNLILLGIHQPVGLWSEEPYDKNREQTGPYAVDYNTYKWFKTEVLEVGKNSPRLGNELYAAATNIEHAVEPYAPGLAHIYKEDRNKQKYGIEEWTGQLLGTSNWAQLKKRAVQFTFSNDRADTVMLDGDIPGIANARSNSANNSILGWKEWVQYSAGSGGMDPNSDLTLKVTEYHKGHMNTRIVVSKNNPEKVKYLPTTYRSWVEEFCKYHKIFKKAAVEYEKKYKEHWTEGKRYDSLANFISEPSYESPTESYYRAAAEAYSIVKKHHEDMMARYVWVHHVELEAHFAPVEYINRPEIFNKHDGKNERDEENWPIEEGATIWHGILKTSEKNGDLFYRVPYLGEEKKEYYKDIDDIISDLEKLRKDVFAAPSLREKEKKYVEDNKIKLINPQMACNDEVRKWVEISKMEINKEKEKAREEARKELKKLKRRIAEEKKKRESLMYNPWIGPKFEP